MTNRLFWLALMVGAFSLPLSDAVSAQSLDLRNSEKPLEIFADDGIEWQQDNLVFLARGNAKAVRDQVTVHGDQLTAFYTERPDGSTDIYRLDADGKVRILSADGVVTGEKAVYDVAKAIMVVTGPLPTMTAPNQKVTATQQLEYWENREMAVARGNAVATQEDRTVKGKVLSAFFRKSDTGESKVYRIEAFDEVEVITKQDKAFGDYGDYNVDSGIATLTGAVRIVRGKNVLTGCRAEVNLNTGISKLFSCPPGQGRRSQGVLVPNSKNR